MLTIASCIFPFRQAIQMQHWTVYNHALPLSSHGCRPISWNRTQIILNSSSLNERQRSKYLSMFPIELLGVKTYPAKSARNLGVIFDKNFNFHWHISAVCSSCIYHIQDLRRIRHHLELERAKLLVNGLVSRRLDYCNRGAGIAERISALDWLLLRYVAIITLPVSKPGFCL